MNPTLKLIANRRSVRRYDGQGLTEGERQAILQAALRAPTAGNQMLYAIIVVEDPALKARLAVTCDNQPFIATAPFLLLFLADYQRWFDYFQYCRCEEKALALGRTPRRPAEGDLLLACCDALIAAQTAVLAAESLGIGSCYIGDILENYEIHRPLFDLPTYAVPAALVCFGRPAARRPAAGERLAEGQAVEAGPGTSRRFSPELVISTDRYQRLDAAGLAQMDAELRQRFGPSGAFIEGAENPGQHMYLHKFTAEFSVEMSRSVGAMLASWGKG